MCCAVKPGTTAQLGAASLICIVFLILHIKVQPFIRVEDNEYQFMAMLSVLLTLFIGTVLRANQQTSEEDDVYSNMMIKIVLIGCNVAILLIFVCQSGSIDSTQSDASTFQDRVQMKLVNSVNKVVLSELTKRIDVVLKEVQEGIQRIHNSDHPVARLLSAIVEVCMHDKYLGIYCGVEGKELLLADLQKIASASSHQQRMLLCFHVASNFSNVTVPPCVAAVDRASNPRSEASPGGGGSWPAADRISCPQRKGSVSTA